MEPLAETTWALRRLAVGQDIDLVAALDAAGVAVQTVVPECVGLSLTMLEEGLTFTLVASHDWVAVIDAMQYLDGGPCDEAVHDAGRISVPDLEVLDERVWRLFARTGAAAGVASTLSLPIQSAQGYVVSGVNLYASGANAFVGKEEAVADIFGAWPSGAVSNADLCFATRFAAAKAPATVEERAVVDLATGVLIAREGVDPLTARQLLRDAASRADVDEVLLARRLVSELEHGGRPPG